MFTANPHFCEWQISIWLSSIYYLEFRKTTENQISFRLLPESIARQFFAILDVFSVFCDCPNCLQTLNWPTSYRSVAKNEKSLLSALGGTYFGCLRSLPTQKQNKKSTKMKPWHFVLDPCIWKNPIEICRGSYQPTFSSSSPNFNFRWWLNSMWLRSGKLKLFL